MEMLIKSRRERCRWHQPVATAAREVIAVLATAENRRPEWCQGGGSGGDWRVEVGVHVCCRNVISLVMMERKLVA